LKPFSLYRCLEIVSKNLWRKNWFLQLLNELLRNVLERYGVLESLNNEVEEEERKRVIPLEIVVEVK
jgi:hypothetical protein